MATPSTDSQHHGLMAKRKPDLDSLSDEQLLDLRICDLGVTIANSPLKKRIEQLNSELADRDLRFTPHCWLSEDWFSPDEIPGIAIPFYLAHPRLMRLERKQLLEVEGGTHEWCMKILRHEAGHAIDTAFRLRRKAIYRNTFGKTSTCGTLRSTRWRISPKHSRFGCGPVRVGELATKIGQRSKS